MGDQRAPPSGAAPHYSEVDTQGVALMQLPQDGNGTQANAFRASKYSKTDNQSHSREGFCFMLFQKTIRRYGCLDLFLAKKYQYFGPMLVFEGPGELANCAEELRIGEMTAGDVVVICEIHGCKCWYSLRGRNPRPEPANYHEASLPVLYGYFRSSCTTRIRIALELKGIKYEKHFVNLLKKEQLADEYAEKNPSKLVPSLDIDGHTLTQSEAILEYLDERYTLTGEQDPHPLLPPGALDRAHVRELALTICADIQPVQNLRVLSYTVDRFGPDEKMPWGKHFITLGFEGLEAKLAKYAGRFCYGDNITLADVCLAPQIYNAKRFGVEMERFPVISRVGEELSRVEAFIRASPEMQEDCPEELRAKQQK
eukprot:Nk52_evm20s1524 gene=Nk52_evmTU20s1524